VISGERAAVLGQFFSEGAIGVYLVFPYMNLQLHFTEEFVNSDLTIAAILLFLADLENVRLGTNAVLMLHAKMGFVEYAE
jgi:hypothetical protein